MLLNRTTQGNFWLAATPHGRYSIAGYAPYPRGATWGSNTFTITRAYCNDLNGHDFCQPDQYCDSAGSCWACSGCGQYLDSFDYFCPAKCGGSSTYSVGDQYPPNATEIEVGKLLKIFLMFA